MSELRVDDHPIPRLDEVMSRFDDTRFNIDPKNDGAVGPLVELIRSNDLGDRICVGAFSDQRLRRIREALGPELCMSPGPRGFAWILFLALVGARRQSSYAAVQIPEKLPTVGIPITGRWLVERYKRQGLQVHVWTINDEADMRRLLDNGVDAIITDRLELFREVLESRGEWP